MTENLDHKSSKIKPEVKVDAIKKRQNFLTKFVVFLSLCFFGYFGIKYLETQQARKSQAKKEVEKFDNVESDIFDLSGDGKFDTDPDGLPDLTVNELKEKGAEFVYQMLLKNQVQINDLNQQLQEIKAEVTKYKNQEKIGKMILIYVDLRQEIFAGITHENSLKNFEMLSASDENLQGKIERLKASLAGFLGEEKLNKSFSNLIPDLIVAKNNNSDATLLSKVRRNISKLVIIRKIDGKNDGEIDSTILKIEKFLNERNYQEAMNSLLSLDQNYHEIIKDFLNDLSIAVEIQKTDQEILNYLKSLT